MIIIAHRGNIDGPSPDENHVTHITTALARGFQVEVDVWYERDAFWLGHDKPTYEVDKSFLLNKKLWCHAKNPAAMKKLIDAGVHHVFWHENDLMALTTSKHFWVYPGRMTSDIAINSVYVMPDIFLGNDKTDAGKRILTWVQATGCQMVCTDYALELREALLEKTQPNEQKTLHFRP